MMDDLLRWWDNLPPEAQVALRDVVVVLMALLAGKLLGIAVKALLTARGFDEHLRLPWSQPQAQRGQRITASDVAGYLCAATVWAGIVWWLATLHRSTGIADAVLNVTAQVWALAVIVGVAMLVGGWVARAVSGLVQNPTVKERLDALFPITDTRAERFSETIARVVGVIIYSFVFLLVVLTGADLFNLTTTASAVNALWHLGLRMFMAAVALCIGWIGLRWSQAQTPPASSATEPTEFTGHQVRLGIIAGTTLLAIALLAASASTIIGVALIALIAVFLSNQRNREMLAAFLRGGSAQSPPRASDVETARSPDDATSDAG